MLRDGFGDKPWFGCLIAEEIHFSEGNNCLPKKKPVGYALFFDIYSTWEGRSLYLEDLYVNPAFRGKVSYRSLLIFCSNVLIFNFVQIQVTLSVMYCLESTDVALQSAGNFENLNTALQRCH